MKGLDGYPLLTETFHIIGNQSFQFLHTGRRLTTTIAIVKEHILKLVFRHGLQLFQGQAAFLIATYILAHCITGYLKSICYTFYPHSHCIATEKIL